MNSFDYIKNENDLNKVRNVAAGRPMESLLFELSVTSGLRLTEILYLRVKDVSDIRSLPFILTPEAAVILEKFLESEDLESDNFLFHKKYNKNQHLSVPYVSNLVTKWFEEAYLEGHYAARSLYKTYEYFYSDRENFDKNIFSDNNIRLKNQVSNREKQLYELLYGRIISGRLPVNTCINVDSIAKDMGSSSTTVRVVLARLEEAKLLERISSRVYKIRGYSAEYISELFNIRQLLECQAYDRAVINWDDSIIPELENLLKQWKSTLDSMRDTSFNPQGIIDCVYYHSAFHAAIYSAANLPVTVGLISELSDKTNGFHLEHYSNDRPDIEDDYRIIADHQLLVDLLKAHKFDECRELLIIHLKTGLKICIAQIEEKATQG